MNVFLWMLMGAAIAWAGYKYLAMNEERGIVASLVIGAAGGFIGGSMVAPMLTSTSAAVAGEFSGDTLLWAALVALGFLALGNHLAKRWGV